MERTVFNAAQLQILDLMAYVESEDNLKGHFVGPRREM